MENPYSPPRSALENKDVEWIDEAYSPQRPMVISAVILSVLTIMGTLSEYLIEHKYGMFVALSYVIFGAFYAYYSVFLLSKMANGLGSDGRTRQLRWWGFLWRAFLAHMLCLIPIGLIKFAFFGKSMSPLVLISVVTGVASVVFLPAVIWAVFSNNRRVQYQWLYMLMPRI